MEHGQTEQLQKLKSGWFSVAKIMPSHSLVGSIKTETRLAFADNTNMKPSVQRKVRRSSCSRASLPTMEIFEAEVAPAHFPKAMLARARLPDISSTPCSRCRPERLTELRAELF